MLGKRPHRQAFIVPETIQVSAMDCGPASLHSLCRGYGLDFSYERLRELCHTDIDGTSIDDIENVANSLGLSCEQCLVAPATLFNHKLPALVVVSQPGGYTHFVVVWRRVLGWLQVMDPADGRRWVRRRALLKDLYVHEMAADPEQLLEYIRSEEFASQMQRNRARIGLKPAGPRHAGAAPDSELMALAVEDGLCRFATQLIDECGLSKAEAAAVYSQLSALPPEELVQRLPRDCWFARHSGGEWRIRGAVAISVAGVARERAAGSLAVGPDGAAEGGGDLNRRAGQGGAATASPATGAGDAQTAGFVADALRRLRFQVAFLAVLLVLALSIIGMFSIEALSFRALIEIPDKVRDPWQALLFTAAALSLSSIVMLLSYPYQSLLTRFGRGMEVYYRALVERRLPLIRPRYFESRLLTDMAERVLSAHQVAQLPYMVFMFIESYASMLVAIAVVAALTKTQLFWAALPVMLLPLASYALYSRLDYNLQAKAGVLYRHFLDALSGKLALNNLTAERSLLSLFERSYSGWLAVFRRNAILSSALDAGQHCFVTLLLFVIVWQDVAGDWNDGAILLVAFWCLQLQVYGDNSVQLLRAFPTFFNRLKRLMEPVTTEEIFSLERGATAIPGLDSGVEIEFKGYLGKLGGKTVLAGLSMRIAAGEHLAVVGGTGSGKSSFISAMLGLLETEAGQVTVNGAAVGPNTIHALKKHTAWMTPETMLWDASFFENILYGRTEGQFEVNRVLEKARLAGELDRQRGGLGAEAINNGRNLAGGQAQRLRLARILETGRKLLILDEPGQSLPAHIHAEIMTTLQQDHPDATLICVTHDMEIAKRFPRVIVLSAGQVVQDGQPGRLLAEEGEFRAFDAAQRELRERLIHRQRWKLHELD